MLLNFQNIIPPFPLFEAQIAFTLPFCLLCTSYTLRTIRAIPGSVGARDKSRSAFSADFRILLKYDFVVGLHIIRQHRLAEPFADQRTRNQLRAGTRFISVIQEQAISLIEITASSADETSDFGSLCRCHANNIGFVSSLLCVFSIISISLLSAQKANERESCR